MDKEQINQLLSQIVAAANGVVVAGEQNMAQLMGICRAARQIHQMINAPKKEESGDGGQDD